jgi:hypothetical protein
VDNDFRVTVGTEAVSPGPQFVSQNSKIVDFAVVYDDDRPVVVAQWLLATCQVDDRKSPMGESDTGLDVHSTLVGTSMQLHLVHPVQ